MRFAPSYKPVAGSLGDADALMKEMQRVEAKLSQINHNMIDDAGTAYTAFVDGASDTRPIKFWHNGTALLRDSSGGNQNLAATLSPLKWQEVLDTGGAPVQLSFTSKTVMWFSFWASTAYTNAGGLFAQLDMRVTINGKPGGVRAAQNVNGIAGTAETSLYLEEVQLLAPGTYTIGVQVLEHGAAGGGTLTNATLIGLGMAR